MWHKLLIGLFLTFSVVIVRGASDPGGARYSCPAVEFGIRCASGSGQSVAGPDRRDADPDCRTACDAAGKSGRTGDLRRSDSLARKRNALAQGLRTQVAARINAIEQAWLTEHPDYVPAAETEKSLITQTPESQQSRNLVFNGYFRENLPARDYEALLRAQRMEAEVAGCAGACWRTTGSRLF